MTEHLLTKYMLQNDPNVFTEIMGPKVLNSFIKYIHKFKSAAISGRPMIILLASLFFEKKITIISNKYVSSSRLSASTSEISSPVYSHTKLPETE